MALGDFRKDNIKRVHQTIKIIVYEIESEPQKVSAEKDVSKKYLKHDVREVENLACNHFICPVSIHLDVFHKCSFDSI